MVEPDAADAGRAITADGVTNPLGWVLCRVTPAAPYRHEPYSGRLLAELAGQKVTIWGRWCDESLLGHPVRTTIQPISVIVIDRGLSKIVEEHGFSQVLRDVDVFAFSDDHDRHVEVTARFPHRPQAHAVPAFAECVDREPAEAMLYGYSQKNLPAAYPLHGDRKHAFTVEPTSNGDVLRIAIDNGTTATGQGFFYAKLTLTYAEPFRQDVLTRRVPHRPLDELPIHRRVPMDLCVAHARVSTTR